MSRMFSNKAWAAFLLGMSLLMFWLFFVKLNFEDNPLASRLAFGLFFFGAAGNLWMFVDCLSHDGRWTPKIWLALLVPFAFVWYYAERYRPRLLRRQKRAR